MTNTKIRSHNMNRMTCAVGIFLLGIIIFTSSLFTSSVYSLIQTSENSVPVISPLPNIKDPKLKVEIVADGLKVPTGMVFLDKDKILVLKRYSTGFKLGGFTTVNVIEKGKLRDKPALTVPSGLCDNNNPQPKCSVTNERGLLGITLKKHNGTTFPINSTKVFLYYTEINLNGDVLGNRVYGYNWNGDSLVNSTLILDLPAKPGPRHNAGKILIGPDGYLYTVIGDQSPDPISNPLGSRLHRGQLQNINSGPTPDNTSVILRINPNNGLPAPGNPLAYNQTDHTVNHSKTRENVMNRYFAYGIRNSFGLAFDPITGNLWDTENGPAHYDEINLVKPGFNSGWRKIMGPISRTNIPESDLVIFPGSKYSDPVFSWKIPIGITDLEFLNSSKFGNMYRDNLFVGDANTGSLYFFKINKNRNGIDFGKDGKEFSDLVADNEVERSKFVLGAGFGIITDIQTGPDGYLYIISYSDYSNHGNSSRIYRIVPAV